MLDKSLKPMPRTPVMPPKQQMMPEATRVLALLDIISKPPKTSNNICFYIGWHRSRIGHDAGQTKDQVISQNEDNNIQKIYRRAISYLCHTNIEDLL